MLNGRLPLVRIGCHLLLFLTGNSQLPFDPVGQTTAAPAQGRASASAPLPAKVQANLDKLEDALNAAEAAGKSKTEATTLNQIGQLYFRTSNYQGALDEYGRALVLARSTKDATQEAAALNGMANCFLERSQSSEARETFQEALNLATSSGDLLGQATALNGIGSVDNKLGRNQNALDYHNKALPLARRVIDHDLEASILWHIGIAYADQGEMQKALDYYSQALPIYREVGDRDGEANTLTCIGIVYSKRGQTQKALDSYNEALPMMLAVGDRDGEANTLICMSMAYWDRGERQRALDSFNRVLPIYQAVGDRGGEAKTLNHIGIVSSDLGEKQNALDSYNEALPIYREVGDPRGEAWALTGIGNVYSDLGEKQKALDAYIRAEGIMQAVDDRDGVANTLIGIGKVYSSLGEREKALDSFRQALQIRRAMGDRGGEASLLISIGNAYSHLGEKLKAIQSFKEALLIKQDVHDPEGEANTLNSIGFFYAEMGEKQKALEYYNQALPIYRAVGDPDGEARTLNNIGSVYSRLGENQKALDYYGRALPKYRAVGDRGGEANALTNIGIIHSHLGEKQKALDYYTEALKKYRAVGGRVGEANTLTKIGDLFSDPSEKQEALKEYEQALSIASAVNEPILEALIYHKLERNQGDTNPALAIFYGKQAVNLLQKVRDNIQSLDEELQASFLASKTPYYRDLADLLIAMGRLEEAQQVLNLLKQQEYSEYVHGEAGDTLSPLTPTPAEREAENEYQRSTAQLVSMSEQWDRLRKNTARTEGQEKELQELKDQFAKASEELEVFYTRFARSFGKTDSADNPKAEVKGTVTGLKQIIAKMPHTVALYTLVGTNRISIIVITGSADVPAVVRESAISEVDLKKKITKFQEVLRHPGQDPKPLAQELYKILIAPVKSDLDQAKAETLVWSLDGVLRYVPMAALHDGKQYVVENYNTATISPTSITNLALPPDLSNMSTVAMGISQQYEEKLPALPAVVGELHEVVKDAKVQGANGALPGTILLNGQFTEKAMENQLGGQPTVVHIASHFVYSPTGDASKSYLLLAGKDKGGEPFHLTVKDFRDNVSLSLTGTELLTLSACDTGVGGSTSDGDEVDGLAMTAEYKHAKAVISSLWSVNDTSTGQLMGDFYKRWADGAGKIEKVEALRQAQLDLLLGKTKAPGDGSARGIIVDDSEGKLPSTFAHPYYWASFVLMGNWR